VKSGGFFGGQTTDARDLAPFSDEKVNAYEIGAKTEWLDRRVRANVSAFYYDYKDLQVYTFVLRNLITVQTLKNASNAHIYGADLELQAAPTDRLNLTLSMEALHARYVDFQSATADYSGNTLPAAPSVSLTASARYELPGEAFGGHLSAYVDARYRNKIFFETRNIDRLTDPARTWVNAEFGWKSGNGKLEIGLWGRNVFNETTIIEIDPIEGLGEDEVTVGRPRTYGIFVRART
jgi:iron complex outermembrane recepter protein